MNWIQREKAKTALKSLAHILAGIITALALLTHLTAAGILMFLLFTIYELDERQEIHDYAFPDLREYAISFFAVILIYIIIEG